MKKIISLIIALVLLVGVFGVTAVAFADEEATTPREEVVVVDTDSNFDGNVALQALVGDVLYIDDDDSFAGWLNTTDEVKSVFKNIVFALSTDEGYTQASDYDTVRLEYTTGDPYYDTNWITDKTGNTVGSNKGLDDVNKKGGTSIELSVTGFVAFRYTAVYEMDDPENEGQTIEKEVSTEPIVLFVRDTTAPVVSLSTTMENKQTSGLTVDTSYSIPTPTITDSSSYTTTYVVSKLINGTYTEVYSSVDGILNDYEGSDISSGTIKPTSDDVLDVATYKITYTVTDTYGHVGNTLDFNLKVVETSTTQTDAEKQTEVWKIVLYVIAGLCAVGIVLLLVIKPKQPVADTRTVYTESKNDSNDQE